MKIALDTETFRIEPGQLFPQIVCTTVAFRDAEGHLQTELWGTDDMDALEKALENVLDNHEILTANGGYDLGVIARAFPRLIPNIFKALAEERVFDVQIRQKLINVGTHGKLDNLTLPGGKPTKLTYGLAVLVEQHLGRDRRDEKYSEDAWRLNYSVLAGVPASKYPPLAAKYAQDDAGDTLEVFEAQEGQPNLETEPLHVAADFALKLMSAWGMAIDQEAVAEVKAQIGGLLGGDTLTPLFKAGIVLPGVDPQPYKNGALDAEGNPKMTKAVKEKRKMGVLKLHLLDICREHDIRVKLTDKAVSLSRKKTLDYSTLMDMISQQKATVDWVATDKKWLPELMSYSELVSLYILRQSLQKLLTSVIPMIEGESRMYPNYDVLKETGRTSSYGSNLKKKRGEKGNLVPSLNVQQQGDLFAVDEEEIYARRMFVPSKGRVLLAADYSSSELCSVAQQTYRILGKSRHKDLLEQGVDLHAYLGAQIARRYHEDFRDACSDFNLTDPLEVYEYFLEHKGGDARMQAFFKHFRTLAKPVGLGYPGGLGPSTMLQLAWDTYKVRITLKEATAFRELWRTTYPEMPLYFEWVNGQGDFENPIIGKYDDGKPIQGYTYQTPLGMRRRGATFCATANGFAMQSPAAEALKIALFELARECYDPTRGSVMFGCRPCAEIHDEIIVDILEDHLMHERATRLKEIMQEAMLKILPDVPVKAEPLLMRRWSKNAKPVFDDAGRLIPWDFEEAS